LLALAAPEQGPAFFVFLCQQFKLSFSCNATFSATTLGPVLTQVLANADVAGHDGRVGVRSHLRRLTEALTCPSPSSLLLDDMSKLRGELVHAPTDARAEPHRLVCETETESTTAAQETEQGASQSSSPVGLPY
jgi:hypothetical protein